MSMPSSAHLWIRRLAVILPLWLALSAIILLIYFDDAHPLIHQWLATLLVTALCALPAIFAAYRLVPRLLYRRRIWAFTASLLLLAAANSVLIFGFAGSLYHLATGAQMFRSALYVVYMLSVFFLANSIVITIGCALKVIEDRFGIETQLHEAREEQVRTELAFLRAQVNPHFLFNVLNTIYFQIRKSNMEARGSVEKLSELLRYQLYECTSDRLPIERELTYIRNYVGMQRLRLEPGTDVTLHIDEGMSGLRIAPPVAAAAGRECLQTYLALPESR
jgi:sensor histidine kinase YesM